MRGVSILVVLVLDPPRSTVSQLHTLARLAAVAVVGAPHAGASGVVRRRARAQGAR